MMKTKQDMIIYGHGKFIFSVVEEAAAIWPLAHPEGLLACISYMLASTRPPCELGVALNRRLGTDI